MAAKLVWIREDGSLTCEHPQTGANGHRGAYEGEYWCELCALHVTAALDQEIAAAKDAAEHRGEAWD